MNQLQLTRLVFSRIGNTLRSRSEAFLAITGPAVIVIVLLSAWLAASLTHLPRQVGLKTLHHIQMEQIGLLLLDWIIGFYIFGALAALVLGARTLAESWRRTFQNWVSILLLALFTWIVWFGLSFTRPLLVNKGVAALNTNAGQISWLCASVLIVIALFTSVPARLDRKLGAFDALVDSISRCGSDYLARLFVTLVFVGIPQVGFQALTGWLGKHVREIQAAGDTGKLQQWANWLRVYGFATYLITLMFMFVALLGFCWIYEATRNPEASVQE